jgi:dienelactone hydrolase
LIGPNFFMPSSALLASENDLNSRCGVRIGESDMKVVFAILVAFVFSGTGIGQTAPSVEDYALMPDMTNVRISPDGSKIVFISGETWESRNIVVVSLDGTAPPVVIDVGDDQVVSSLEFASNTHLWLTYMDRGQYTWTRGDYRWQMRDEGYIWREYIVRIADQTVVELGQGTRFASIDEADPESVLTWVQAERRGGHVFTRVRGGIGYGLFRQDLDRRRGRSRVEIGVRDFSYLLNANDEPVVRQRGGHDANDSYELWTRIGTEGDGWRRVYQERHSLYREFSFGSWRSTDWVGVIEWISGLDPTGRYGYFSSETLGEPGTFQPGRRTAIYRFDFLEETIDGPVAQSDLSDIYSSNLLRDWRTNAVIGVRIEEERPRIVYFEPEFAALQTQIEGFFPDANVNLVDWDAQIDQFIVNVSGGHTSGVYYLVNRVSGEVALLAPARPQIPDSVVGPMEVVHYEARDGLALFGYLTTPAGRQARDLPLVVMPHGGPEARDYYGYDEWAQVIASRGYAVFQPQFRGSGDYGVEFAEAGYGNWGAAMQNDLDDGVDHLVAAGIIDSERVCIFGWSYGGYAALAGVSLTPERYRCGIAGAGVSDIIEMMEWAQTQNGGSSLGYWGRNIGDWRGQHRSGIEAISPAQQAAQIQAPVMIVHGTEDIVVPFSQAELMAAAMDEAGKPYELITIEGGRHYSIQMTVEHKLALYENLIRFLLEHNPPDGAAH